MLRGGRGLWPQPTWGRAQPVNVEYVSANPTGPMHVGHCRGAVFGDALANLLAFDRLRGHARILHQRRRRPGRRARALGLPALPRGARRGHRRDPGRALSRRLSQAGRRGAGGRVRRRSAEASRRATGCRWCAQKRDRHDDGDDPRRSRRAQRQARRVLLRALADRGRDRPGGADHRRSARAGARLRGPPAAAQGRADRGLGGPRADAVPRDRVRRRRRPAADEIGRQLHLFRRRHRLSQEQVRPRLPAT